MGKRTAEDASLSTSATSQAEDGPGRQGKKRKVDSSSIKATKSTKKATTASRKAKKVIEPSIIGIAPQRLQPMRVSKALANKIKQVKTFRDNNGSDKPILSRSEGNNAHVILVESALAGALLAMAHDWGVKYTYLTALLEVEGAVIKRFNKRHDYENDSWQMPMVILDLSKTTAMERVIHAKIEGHGTADLNLLQIQLEMYTKQLIGFGEKRLLHASEKAEPWSEEEDEQPDESATSTPNRMDEGAEQGESNDMEQHTDSPACVKAVERDNDIKEDGGTGVGPAPKKDL